jgi:hypothetical protein
VTAIVLRDKIKEIFLIRKVGYKLNSYHKNSRQVSRYMNGGNKDLTWLCRVKESVLSDINFSE